MLLVSPSVVAYYFSALKMPPAYPVTRLLTQTLSNIVTTNDASSQKLWTSYLSLPEEKLIITQVSRRFFSDPNLTTRLHLQ